jgi:hypothetical protein
MLLPHRNLTRSTGVIEVSKWLDEKSEVGEFIAWQPGMDIEVGCEIEIDLAEATRILGFDPTGTTGIAVEWMSDSTRLRESCGVTPLVNEHLSIRAILPGARIGGRVSLQRRLVTIVDLDGDEPFVPKQSGSLLWEDEVDFRVEGSGPQFPVITTSFTGSGLPRGAIWAIRVPEDASLLEESALDEPAAEHVCVRLNVDHPIAGRIAKCQLDDEVTRLAFGQISCELARGLVSLASVEGFAIGSYLPGSLGDVVSTVLNVIGYTSSSEINSLDTEFFSALLQDRFLDWTD